MSKRQTRSATRAAKRPEYDVMQSTMMFVLKLVVLNGYVEIAKPCAGLCRETWALPEGLSDEDTKLFREDNVMWPHLLKEKKETRKHESWTRLHWAASKGYTSRVIELVKWGYNIEDQSLCGSPLMIATNNNHKYTVRALLKLGADVDAVNYDYRGNTPLLLACTSSNKVDIVAELLSAGADVNKSNFYGETPLVEAFLRSNNTIKKMLLDAGADFTAIDEWFKTCGWNIYGRKQIIFPH
jgi:hypothetical protein